MNHEPVFFKPAAPHLGIFLTALPAILPPATPICWAIIIEAINIAEANINPKICSELAASVIAVCITPEATPPVASTVPPTSPWLIFSVSLSRLTPAPSLANSSTIPLSLVCMPATAKDNQRKKASSGPTIT